MASYCPVCEQEVSDPIVYQSPPIHPNSFRPMPSIPEMQQKIKTHYGPTEKDTLIVNFFGGPGSGKSSLATGVFSKMKRMGYNCEYVSEFAKELVWEGRLNELGFQARVAMEQAWRIYRMKGKADCIITDSPYLLSSVYNSCLQVDELLLNLYEDDCQMSTNFLVLRNHENRPYQSEGRNEKTEADARKVDAKVFMLLEDNKIRYRPIVFSPDDNFIAAIATYVIDRLGGGK